MNQKPIVIKQATNTDAQELRAKRLQKLKELVHKKLLEKGYPYLTDNK